MNQINKIQSKEKGYQFKICKMDFNKQVKLMKKSQIKIKLEMKNSVNETKTQ